MRLALTTKRPILSLYRILGFKTNTQLYISKIDHKAQGADLISLYRCTEIL